MIMETEHPNNCLDSDCGSSFDKLTIISQEDMTDYCKFRSHRAELMKESTSHS